MRKKKRKKKLKHVLLEAREKRRGLEGRNLLGKKMGREEEEEEAVIGEEHEVTRESIGGR